MTDKPKLAPTNGFLGKIRRNYNPRPPGIKRPHPPPPPPKSTD